MRGRREWPPEVIERARKLYLAGHSMRAIGRKLAVPHQTVSFWARKYNWEAERKQAEVARRVAVEVAERSEATLVEETLRRWQERARKVDGLIARAEELLRRLEEMAEGKPRAVTRAVWAFSQAVRMLTEAQAEDRQMLKLAVDAKLAQMEAQQVVEVGDYLELLSWLKERHPEVLEEWLSETSQGL